MYDLLLKGGTVVDPSRELHGVHDIAVQDGKIASIAPGIPSEEASRVIDVSGKIVTAGMIDVHIHVFDGFTSNGVNPDLGGVHSGVTTLVDAGSAGCATFSGFPRHIIPRCHTEIIPFMHICQTGLATNPDIIAESSIDLEGTLKAVDQHKGLVHGIKARMVSPALEIFGMEMPRLAKRAAKESGIKPMVHIGDTKKRYDPNVIRELLPILEEGDILTHYFTANPGGVLDANGRLVPEAREAADRGVWFDTAHGRMNFSFDVGRRVVDQGLLPHCISTDLTVQGRVRTVHSMTGKGTHRSQHDGDDDPLSGHGIHPGPGRHHVHLQPRQGHRRGGPAGKPGRRPAGGHLGAGDQGGRLGGVRRPGREPAGGQDHSPSTDGEEGPGVRARLGPPPVGLGARPGLACTVDIDLKGGAIHSRGGRAWRRHWCGR